MTLSVISLPGMKALCDSEIIAGRMVLSRLAMALDTPLYISLHRVMGLSSTNFLGFPFFGISTMEVTMMSLGRYRLLRKSKQADVTSSPTIS